MKVYALATEITTPRGTKSTYSSGVKVLIESEQVVAIPITVNGGDGAEVHAAIGGKEWVFKTTASVSDLVDASTVAADDVYVYT